MKILLGALLFLAALCAAADNKIRERDIQVLVLRAGEFAAGVRTTGVPQLLQRPGNGPRPHIREITCRNVGTDGVNVVWDCKPDGSIPDNMYITNAQVSCEGFAHADDEFILARSCALEYDVVEKTPPPPSYAHTHPAPPQRPSPPPSYVYTAPRPPVQPVQPVQPIQPIRPVPMYEPRQTIPPVPVHVSTHNDERDVASAIFMGFVFICVLAGVGICCIVGENSPPRVRPNPPPPGEKPLEIEDVPRKPRRNAAKLDEEKPMSVVSYDTGAKSPQTYVAYTDEYHAMDKEPETPYHKLPQPEPTNSLSSALTAAATGAAAGAITSWLMSPKSATPAPGPAPTVSQPASRPTSPLAWSNILSTQAPSYTPPSTPSAQPQSFMATSKRR